MNQSKKFILNAYRKSLKKFSFGYGISKHWPFNKILNQIESSFIENYVKLEDHVMYLDKNDNLGLSINPVYGEADTKIVKQIIKPGDTVLDIGANIGYFTLIFANIVGNSGKIFSFEPEPENFKILKKNVEVNGYINVVLEQKIVSNNNGQTTLYISDKAGSHRIHQPDNYVKSIDVDSISLDNYTKQNSIQKIDFIKIDVEGAEFNVLKGLQKIINSNKNITLLVEYSPNQIKSCGIKPTDMIDFLKENNFKIYFSQIQNNQTKFFEFEKIYTLKNYENKTLNLLCSKLSFNDISKLLN